MHARPLRLLFITGYPCIRALKEATALQRRGHNITLLYDAVDISPQWAETAEGGIYKYDDLPSYRILVKKLGQNCDIIHGHNEPNWHIALAFNQVKDKPVVYDCHDFTSMRGGASELEINAEKVCFERSAAVIHVSEELRRQAELRYSVKNSLVLYSLPSKNSFPFTPRSKLSGVHVAYEGGLSHTKNSPHNYRYYLDYFKAIAASGVYVHIFPSSVTTRECRNAYSSEAYGGIRLYATQPYENLLRTLSAVQWGFSGFFRAPGEQDAKSIYLDNAMPNKLFEYLFAGITPIVLNCKAAGHFVTEHNIGYHVKSIEEFIDVAHNAPPLVQNLDPLLIDMDHQIIQLEKLYRDILG